MVQTSYAAVLIATVALSAVSSTVASSFGNEQLQSRGMQRVRVAREVDDFELFARGGKGKKHHHHKHHHKVAGGAAADAMAAPAPEAAAAPAPDASGAAPAARDFDDEYELFARGGKGHKKHHHKHHHKAAGGAAAAAGAMSAPAPDAAAAPAPDASGAAPAARDFDDEYELFARGGKGHKKHHHKHHHKAAGGAAAAGAMAAPAPDAAAAPAPDASGAAPAARYFDDEYELFARGGKGHKKHHHKHHHKAAGGAAAGAMAALAPDAAAPDAAAAPVAARSGWGSILEDGLKAGKSGIKYAKEHHLAHKAIKHAPGVVDAIQQGQQTYGRDYTDEMFERDFEEFLEARSRSRTHQHSIAPALGHGILGLAQNYVAQKVQQNQMQQDPSQMQGREFDEYDYFGRSYENMEELD